MRGLFVLLFAVFCAAAPAQVVSLRLFEYPDPVPLAEMPLPLGADVQSGFMDYLFDSGFIATSERSARCESGAFRPFEGQDLEDARNGLVDYVVDAMVSFRPSAFRKELWIPVSVSWRVLDVAKSATVGEGSLGGIADDGDITKEAPGSSATLGRNLAKAVGGLILR
jgi:hypothetical protein